MSDKTEALSRAADSIPLSKTFEQAGRGEWPLIPGFTGARDRIIVLNGEVTREKADNICMQMLAMSLAKPGQDILFYINSPGGSVTAGMAIYDMMKRINCDVRTIGNGQCASMGSFLLAAGTKGKRSVFPNTQIMMHQPRAGTEGPVSDMERNFEEFKRIKDRMAVLYAHFLDIGYEDCVRLMDRDTFVNAVAAQELGHVDQIVVRAPVEGRPDSEEDKKLFQLEMDIQRRELLGQPALVDAIARRNAGRPAPAARPVNAVAPANAAAPANDDVRAPPAVPRLAL